MLPNAKAGQRSKNRLEPAKSILKQKKSQLTNGSLRSVKTTETHCITNKSKVHAKPWESVKMKLDLLSFCGDRNQMHYRCWKWNDWQAAMLIKINQPRNTLQWREWAAKAPGSLKQLRSAVSISCLRHRDVPKTEVPLGKQGLVCWDTEPWAEQSRGGLSRDNWNVR